MSGRTRQSWAFALTHGLLPSTMILASYRPQEDSQRLGSCCWTRMSSQNFRCSGSPESPPQCSCKAGIGRYHMPRALPLAASVAGFLHSPDFRAASFLLTHHFNNTLLAWAATSRFLTLFQLALFSPLDTTTVRFHQQASTLSNRQRLLTWSANFQGIATNTSLFTSFHQSTTTFNTAITR